MIVDIDTDAPLLREHGSSTKVYAVSDFDASLGDAHRFTPADMDAEVGVSNGVLGDLFRATQAGPANNGL